jgi:hypothetical protein
MPEGIEHSKIQKPKNGNVEHSNDKSIFVTSNNKIKLFLTSFAISGQAAGLKKAGPLIKD